MESTTENEQIEIARILKSTGVGLENLPKQVIQKYLQKGFTFNLLCIGETGIGKSSLLNNLFNIDANYSQATHFHSEVSVRERIFDIYEGDIQIKLTIAESVGYGDKIDRSGDFDPIAAFLDIQFERYLQEELKLRRQIPDTNLIDSRIHACLYFIAPTGRNLKSIDLLCMRTLQHKVNIIPIIAKADLLTKEESNSFKQTIRSEFEWEQLELYGGYNDTDFPFAVVSSDCSRKWRAYPWGNVEIEDAEHSDFGKLRDLLIGKNAIHLKETTHAVHYERYRRARLREIFSCLKEEVDEDANWMDAFVKEKAKIREEAHMREVSMRQNFLKKIENMQLELEDEEREITSRFEEMRLQCELEHKELQEEKCSLYKANAIWWNFRNTYIRKG